MLGGKKVGQKVFKIKKRIISGVENLDTMRFSVGRFTSFFPEIEFLPILILALKFQGSS